MPYKPIEDYRIIGDLHSIALVGVDGSIDWCCLPNFDSPSVFGALLDEKQGGYFKIAAQAPNHAKQLYLPDTNVLITRIFSDQGIAEITDFMPIEPRTLEGKRPHCHQIIRRVHTVSGQIDFRLECFPAFDYARQSHQVRHYPQGAALVSSSASVGLVSRVYPDAEVEERAAGVLRGLAGIGASALALTKQQFYQLDGLGFADGIQLGADVNAVSRTTPEFRAALSAFLRK